MKRERILTAIKSLEEHAVTTDEKHLINYLKINLGNLWELEDDEDNFSQEDPNGTSASK